MSDEYGIENRTLVISNFRNLGPFCGGKGKEFNEDKAFLKINRSLERDALGGLVILVGVNNSGKSNVLDALGKYHSNVFEPSDYTDFTFASDVKPSISMNIANGAYRLPKTEDSGEHTLIGEWQDVLSLFLLEKENYEFFRTSDEKLTSWSYDEYARSVYQLIDAMQNQRIRSDDLALLKRILENRNDTSILNVVIGGKGEIDDVIDPDNNATPFHSLVYQNGGVVIYNPVKIQSSGSLFHFRTMDINITIPSSTVSLLNHYNECLDRVRVEYSDKMTLTDEFFDKHGYTLSNKVYRYTRQRIRQDDLSCHPSEPNQFFKNLFNIVGFSADAVKDSYSGAGLKRFMVEDLLNKELVSISEELNDLLNIKEKRYFLRVRLESERMQFSIFYGDGVPLNLDRQSQGFTWLFELFFNLMKTASFNPGDMVLIDEFGDSLGFSTVKELTGKLREYGQRNGITFVLATQNPMAVDITRLDEVRLVVPHPDGSSTIVNQFDHYGNIDDHDAVGPVINGLMVSRNFMRRENRRTVFVEGVMDYFYLNSFAEKFRAEGMDIDLDFIPMNGLGSAKDDPKLLIDQITSIERNPTILVDSDAKGKQIIKAAKDSKRLITVVGIDEILDGMKEIEDLFSKADAQRLVVKEKSFDRGATIAHTFDSVYDDLQEETKKNFRDLIEYISDA